MNHYTLNRKGQGQLSIMHLFRFGYLSSPSGASGIEVVCDREFYDSWLSARGFAANPNSPFGTALAFKSFDNFAECLKEHTYLAKFKLSRPAKPPSKPLSKSSAERLCRVVESWSRANSSSVKPRSSQPLAPPNMFASAPEWASNKRPKERAVSDREYWRHSLS
jgi:hypothetical protein